MPYYVHDKIISPNIWDEQWEVGGINGTTGEKETANYRIRSKNLTKCIPNTTYYARTNNKTLNFYLYDANKNYLGNVAAIPYIKDTTFNIPSNAYYFMFQNVFDNVITYNHDICINVSNPTINGNYYPYNMGGKPYVIKDNNNSMNIGG